MKTIAKIGMLLLLVTSAAVITAEAQPGYGKGWHGHGHGHRYGHGMDSCHIELMVADLSEFLSLDDGQKAEILDIHYAHMQEMKSISEEYKDDCVGEREARIASRKKTQEAVKKVLTDEQQEKFDEFMTDQRGQRRHHYHHHWK